MRLRARACSIMAVSLAMVIWHAQAQTAAVNLSGNYRCEPQSMSCRSGLAFRLTLNGRLEKRTSAGSNSRIAVVSCRRCYPRGASRFVSAAARTRNWLAAAQALTNGGIK
jgi:hypothetical protein